MGGLAGIPEEGQIVSDKLRRSIDLVSDAGSQLPDSLQFLRLTQLSFDRTPFGDVFLNRHKMTDRALGIGDGRNRGGLPKKFAVLLLVAQFAAPLAAAGNHLPQVAVYVVGDVSRLKESRVGSNGL